MTFVAIRSQNRRDITIERDLLVRQRAHVSAFHGLGFATVMGHLPFRMMNLVKVVFAFNVGVEIGQVAIVAAIFPIIFLSRKSQYYEPLVLVGGSLVITLLSSWWLLQRAFEL